MRMVRFARLLLAGSLLAIAACASPGRVDPKSGETHNTRQAPLDSSSGAGGGGGY